MFTLDKRLSSPSEEPVVPSRPCLDTSGEETAYFFFTWSVPQRGLVLTAGGHGWRGSPASSEASAWFDIWTLCAPL